MKIYTELDLENFDAWAGAINTLNTIRAAGKITECEQLLKELYYDSELTENQLNDILWFEDEWLFEQLGIKEDDDTKKE